MWTPLSMTRSVPVPIPVARLSADDLRDDEQTGAAPHRISAFGRRYDHHVEVATAQAAFDRILPAMTAQQRKPLYKAWDHYQHSMVPVHAMEPIAIPIGATFVVCVIGVDYRQHASHRRFCSDQTGEDNKLKVDVSSPEPSEAEDFAERRRNAHSRRVIRGGAPATASASAPALRQRRPTAAGARRSAPRALSSTASFASGSQATSAASASVSHKRTREWVEGVPERAPKRRTLPAAREVIVISSDEEDESEEDVFASD
jgi:hypothetical protein